MTKAPLPDGAVSTARFEMMREGVQECEARIFIEKALLSDELREKLGRKLAEKVQTLLDERTRAIAAAHRRPWRGRQSVGNCVSIGGYERYLKWNWQQHSDELYAAAAEVADTLGEK